MVGRDVDHSNGHQGGLPRWRRSDIGHLRGGVDSLHHVEVSDLAGLSPLDRGVLEKEKKPPCRLGYGFQS